MKIGANLCVNYSSADMQITGTDTKSASYSHYGTKLSLQAGDKFIGADGKTYILGNGPKEPDVILIMIGLNDYLNDATCSDFTHADINNKVLDDSEQTDSDYNDVKTAYERILNDIQATYPYADVYCITQPAARYNNGTFPFLNSECWCIQYLDELIRFLTVKFGVKHISLSHICVKSTRAFTNTNTFLRSDLKQMCALLYKRWKNKNTSF